MLRQLRCLPLLSGYRDRRRPGRIINVWLRLGARRDPTPGARLDINPLFIAGPRIAAADARATLA